MSAFRMPSTTSARTSSSRDVRFAGCATVAAPRPAREATSRLREAGAPRLARRRAHPSRRTRGGPRARAPDRRSRLRQPRRRTRIRGLASDLQRQRGPRRARARTAPAGSRFLVEHSRASPHTATGPAIHRSTMPASGSSHGSGTTRSCARVSTASSTRRRPKLSAFAPICLPVDPPRRPRPTPPRRRDRRDGLEPARGPSRRTNETAQGVPRRALMSRRARRHPIFPVEVRDGTPGKQVEA